MANLDEEPVESYGYFTDVLQSLAGKEQRIGLRRHPAGGIEFAWQCHSLNDAQHVAALVHAFRVKPWIVPLWCHARPLGASIGLGGTAITVDTVNAPFQDPLGLGLYCVLWGDTRTYEAVPIDTVSPTSITLLDPTTKAWGTLGTYVIPARVGYLVDESVEHDWITGKVTGGRVRFTFDAVEEALEAAAAPEGITVFGELDEPPL